MRDSRESNVGREGTVNSDELIGGVARAWSSGGSWMVGLLGDACNCNARAEDDVPASSERRVLVSDKVLLGREDAGVDMAGEIAFRLPG